MFRAWFSAGMLAVAMACAAHAEIKAAAPDALVFQFKGEIPLPREAAWTRVLAIGSWWNDGHTYSGKAANMSIDPVAGGCWCETWPGGGVEHGRVIAMVRDELLRMQTALGPLQDTGVNAAMTITLADGATPGTTVVTLDYRVVGSSLTELSAWAEPVNGVLQEQFGRLLKPAE
jgi:uncharacterized protein YndB with AHSA1/START domain